MLKDNTFIEWFIMAKDLAPHRQKENTYKYNNLIKLLIYTNTQLMVGSHCTPVK